MPVIPDASDGLPVGWVVEPRHDGCVVTTIRVDPFNPFETNRVGIGGPAFPLSIRRERCGTVWTVRGTALRAVDFVDLAAGLLDPVSVICNVGQTAFVDAHRTPLPAGMIATEQGVTAQVHNLAWASLSGSPTHADVLVVASSDLERFFSGWSLYDVDLIDAPTKPSLNSARRSCWR